MTGPTVEPITVEDAKQQARITDDSSDILVASYVVTAREAAEDYMGRGILTQTWKLVLDRWANVIPLPMASPLQNGVGTAPTITYYDSDGAQQTLSTSIYAVDTVSRPGTISLAPNQSWPTLQSSRLNGNVAITYVVGWTSADLVPERIKQGIRQYVTYLDADRDGMEVQAVAALQAAERCWSDRIWWTTPRWC